MWSGLSGQVPLHTHTHTHTHTQGSVTVNIVRYCINPAPFKSKSTFTAALGFPAELRAERKRSLAVKRWRGRDRFGDAGWFLLVVAGGDGASDDTKGWFPLPVPVGPLARNRRNWGDWEDAPEGR